MSNFRGGRKPYTRPERAVNRGNADGVWRHDMAPGFPGARPAANGRVQGGAAVNSKLVVSNLHYEITPKDLASIFGQIGTLVNEPVIRYDRSGRSTGTAVITFENPAEAIRAKKQFDGILAKDQPMSIVFEQTSIAPKGPRGQGNGGGNSLLDRIQKPPLLDRLTSDDSGVAKVKKAAKASQPQTQGNQGGVGPVRNKRGGPGGATKEKREKKKKPQTAEDLDKELDAFFAEDTKDAVTVAASNGEDVDMV